MNKDAKKAKQIIKEGADINQRTFAGESALMMAVRFGLADVVRMLALRGCDLFEKNFKGESLLHIAARADQAEVIGYLLDKGLPTIDMNRDGYKPMDLAQRPAIKQLLSVENAKTFDLYTSQGAVVGSKMQPRIRGDQLDSPSRAESTLDLKQKQKQAENNGKLLNEAIIKYRIEKKDIIDSAYRSQFSQYAGGS